MRVKVECTRGFGRVEHPETGEEINVEEPFETDQETFALLDDAYPGFRIVERLDGTQDTEDYNCGVNGCSRDVDGPEDTCWQH
jgi:hypothetical protein